MTDLLRLIPAVRHTVQYHPRCGKHILNINSNNRFKEGLSTNDNLNKNFKTAFFMKKVQGQHCLFLQFFFHPLVCFLPNSRYQALVVGHLEDIFMQN